MDVHFNFNAWWLFRFAYYNQIFCLLSNFLHISIFKKNSQKWIYDLLLGNGVPLTLLGPTYFLYTKARGGGEISPPHKQSTFSNKKHVFCHGVNFCINSALFWCITQVSSSMLTKINNFIEKRSKFGTFLEIELYASYTHQNKAKTT